MTYGSGLVARPIENIKVLVSNLSCGALSPEGRLPVRSLDDTDTATSPREEHLARVVLKKFDMEQHAALGYSEKMRLLDKDDVLFTKMSEVRSLRSCENFSSYSVSGLGFSTRGRLLDLHVPWLGLAWEKHPEGLFSKHLISITDAQVQPSGAQSERSFHSLESLPNSELSSLSFKLGGTCAQLASQFSEVTAWATVFLSSRVTKVKAEAPGEAVSTLADVKTLSVCIDIDFVKKMTFTWWLGPEVSPVKVLPPPLELRVPSYTARLAVHGLSEVPSAPVLLTVLEDTDLVELLLNPFSSLETRLSDWNDYLKVKAALEGYLRGSRLLKSGGSVSRSDVVYSTLSASSVSKFLECPVFLQFQVFCEEGSQISWGADAAPLLRCSTFDLTVSYHNLPFRQGLGQSPAPNLTWSLELGQGFFQKLHSNTLEVLNPGLNVVVEIHVPWVLTLIGEMIFKLQDYFTKYLFN
jgi:hypothetical protein